MKVKFFLYNLIIFIFLLSFGCATYERAPVVYPAPEQVLQRVADRVLVDHPEPVPWNWGEGVLMAGMMRAYEETRNPDYLEFVQNWTDHWKTQGIKSLLNKRGYCGHWGPAYPALLLYEETKKDSYLELGQAVIDFIQNEAARTSDGGLDHWRDNKQLWVDTLFMACPPLVTMGRLVHKPELIEEAARQLEIYAKHLQNPKTGLFYHMYNERTGTQTDEFWGRGNGWVAMSYVTVLKALGTPASHPKRFTSAFTNLAADFKQQAKALMKYQDSKTGLWHTVIDRPDSYLETSASAMILYSLIQGHQMKIIDVPHEIVTKTWEGITSKIDPCGRVIDVSAGTGPGTYDDYIQIERGTETWGTGAVLLAASELSLWQPYPRF